MTVKGKTVLVTGATDGVGRRVAERLGAAGAEVLIHGRDAARAESLRAAIAAAGGRASIHLADLASLDAVRALAAAVARDHRRLDILINSAGVGFGRDDRRELSVDGHELRFAVNYLSGFLLTHLLLPLVVAAKGRIVNVASIGQEPLDFDDVMLARRYDGHRAYRRSKLAQIMFTIDLAKELDGTGVTVNAVHPATFMDTAMVRGDGITPMSSVEEGADAILQLAASPDLDGRTGLYFDGLRPARAHVQAYDAAARARLRALSLALAGLDPSSSFPQVQVKG
ncbi:NAD(P)-dependent dehydrogenase, short-chain alcohol dehydrogenase family [Enhydrobacter aerosaccus]|uniref:NAD(P)-dependent dehydrogenase, short-chain alcohol dehydrogenase family n=1 Tax=Enhydrobacter aerosaccus TaxID=225324 RepID=A0A1T4SRR0_9HYPH|nr:SDR family NAD(P)-dependent oxidoreductase [Enhydrobacter aerosaccus]SKA30980.1 NAD(P)-dependent dehydrogenase, short-chain alcohol dehydrogenase family [Enhydrobacter aerosaccus]